MIAALATAAGFLLVVSIVRAARRRAALPAYVQLIRAVYAEAHVYRVSTSDELARVPIVTVTGMRPLGGLATTVLGKSHVSRYLIDESQTIVATRHESSLYLFSTTDHTAFETVCFPAGLPRSSPDVDHLRLPVTATDAQMLASHRTRLMKASEPLIRIQTIEHLAELQTQLSQRGANWRATQAEDALLDADLCSIVGSDSPSRVNKLKAKLVRPARATLRRS